MTLKCLLHTKKNPFLQTWYRRTMCTGPPDKKQFNSCKLLIVGGGTAGCTVAAKFARKMTKCEIFVVEPNDIHYYQTAYTFIGVGLDKLRDAVKPTIITLPENVTWIKDSVLHFCPSSSSVITQKDRIIQYDYMVIATGIELDFDKIKGLKEGLELYDNVTTVTSPEYAEKTFKCLSRFASGNAVFTHPAGRVKYISLMMCFLAEDYFRKHDKLCDTQIFYVTGQPAIFYIDKYTKALTNVARRKSIELCCRNNLIEIDPEHKIAIFEDPKNPGERCCIKYELLHVTPPMGPIEPLRNCKELTNEHGSVDVDKETLQHKTHINIFAIGDCSSLPTSKTASAIAAQAIVLHKNLSSVMAGNDPKAHYDGYAAWPIITGYGTCILAEHDYLMNPTETLPCNQDRESKFVYYLKKDVMPKIYWNLFLTGRYPAVNRLSKLFSWYKSQK